MIDPGFDWQGAMMQFKNGVDMLRTTVGLVRDIRDVLPEGTQKEAISSALEQSAQQIHIAEAQIAAGLGYELCRCQFPPSIMLNVGVLPERGPDRKVRPIYECPNCGYNTAEPYAFTRKRTVHHTE